MDAKIRVRVRVQSSGDLTSGVNSYGAKEMRPWKLSSRREEKEGHDR